MPLAPRGSIAPQPMDSNTSEVPSKPLSPPVMPALSQQTSHDDKVQAEFESGGIRLKKKASVNFGAPFGSLGFSRKQS
jgi:hypothetical protein